MIKFTKTPMERNYMSDAEVDTATIEMSIDDGHTLGYVLEQFKYFLTSCGYPIDFQDELILEEPEDENDVSNRKEIEIEMDDDQFVMISKMAHDKDITFNDMCNEILRNFLDDKKAQEEFDSVLANLTKRDMEAYEEHKMSELS